MAEARRRDDIRMCIDRFVPEDRVSAAEADALAQRPDNLRPVPIPGGRALGRPRMATITEALWRPGTVIKARFMDGTDIVQQKVEQVAHEWEDHANVRFEFSADPALRAKVNQQVDQGQAAIDVAAGRRG